MAGRTQAAWKGMVKLGLVTIPCRMISAADQSDKVEFHLHHSECKSRVNFRTWCPACSKEISRADTVKGHEYAKGQVVMLTSAELKSVEDTASSTLTVMTVTSDPIEPAYVDGTLLLIPEPVGVAAFETLRVALARRGARAVGEVVIRSRACQVALEPTPRGFVVYKMRAAEQVRTFEDLDLPVAPEPSAADLALADQLLAAYEGPFSHEDVHDEYTTRLKALITRKAAGVEAADATAAVPTPSLGSLTDALRASLASIPAARPVKVEDVKPVAVKAAPRRRRA